MMTLQITEAERRCAAKVLARQWARLAVRTEGYLAKANNPYYRLRLGKIDRKALQRDVSERVRLAGLLRKIVERPLPEVDAEAFMKRRDGIGRNPLRYSGQCALAEMSRLVEAVTAGEGTP